MKLIAAIIEELLKHGLSYEEAKQQANDFWTWFMVGNIHAYSHCKKITLEVGYKLAQQRP